MSHLTVRLSGRQLPEDLRVHELHGVERIGQVYEHDLLVAIPGGIEPQAVLGSRATLSLVLHEGAAREDLAREPGATRCVHGLIVGCVEEWNADGDDGLYRLKLVPRLWRANLVQTLDIYMELSVPEIIALKLGRIGLATGVDLELRLNHGYPKREFVVQYQETDLSFLSRLCEHEGIAFFFEQRDDRDVVVFTDANTGYPAVLGEGVTTADKRVEARAVTRLRSTATMLPRRYIQNDYNYRTPNVGLSGMAQAEGGHAGAIVEYGGHFKTPDEGAHLAMVRAEERAAEANQLEGEGNDPLVAAGHRLRVTGHRRGDLELILVEVEHHAKQGFLSGAEGSNYSNRFRAVTTTGTYRPPRRTPKPRISGLLTGLVEGAEGSEYAEVDDQGRYRVRFLFDTTFEGERQASRAIRMMQPHSGPGYGMHFPLRGGVEVLIAFLGGDPDRPIIAGTVPNPRTQSPVSTTNSTRNVIRTGGGNEINIDDTKAGQRIKLSTPLSNTVFQLGSPNAPELGAILTTQGASSTNALGHVSALAGQTMTFASALQSTFSSMSIVSVAKDTTWLEKILALGTGALKAPAYLTLKGLGAIKAGVPATRKGAETYAKGAYEVAGLAEGQCKKCRKEALAKAAGTPEEAALEDWAKKEEAADAKYKAYVAAMQDRRATTLKALKKSKNPLVAAAKAEYEQAEKDLKASRTALPTPAPCAECESLPGLRKNAADAEQALFDMNPPLNYLSTAVGVAEKTVGAVDKGGSLLLSAVTSLTTLLVLKGSASSLIERWQHTQKRVAEIKLKQQTTAALMSVVNEVKKTNFSVLRGNLTPKTRLHSVGSENQMEVFGKDGMLAWGNSAAVVGMGTTKIGWAGLSSLPDFLKGVEFPNAEKGQAFLVGGKNAYVLAGSKAEIGAKDSVVIASTKIDIRGTNGTDSAGSVTVWARKKLDLYSKLGTLNAQAKQRVVLHSTDDRVSVIAAKGVTVKSNTDAITVKASKDIALTSDTANVKATATSGNINLTASAGELSGSSKSISLKGTMGVTATAGASKLDLASAQAKLESGASSLTLGAATAKLESTSLTIDAANVEVNGKAMTTISGGIVRLG